MKKLLSILGSVGMIGTAGATVVACGNNNKPKEDTKDEVAGKLEADIQEAEGLINTNKKEASVKEALQTAINKAKETFNNKDATVEQLKTASSDLRKAIEVYNQAPNDPKEAAKTELANLIGQAKGLVEAAEKEASAVEALQSAIAEAETVLKGNEVTVDQLTAAKAILQTAIETYENAKGADVAAKETLKAKIDEASKLAERAEKTDEAVKTFKSEISKAQAILDKTSATTDELTSAISDLQKAIENYNNADKNGLAEARSELQKNIFQALGAVTQNPAKKTDQEVKSFTKIIDEAREVYKTSEDENKVKETAEALQKATDEFRKAKEN